MIAESRMRAGPRIRPADQLFFDQVEAPALHREDLRQAAQVNTPDDFRLVFEKELEGLFVDRMEGNDDIFRRVMQDKQFRAMASAYLMSKVYAKAREGSRSPS